MKVIVVSKKICPICNQEKPLTPEYWYVARVRRGHNKQGWQSFCKDCWKVKNNENKQRIRKAKEPLL